MDDNNNEYIIGSDDINEDTTDEEIDKLFNNSTRSKASIEIEEIREVPCAKKSELIQKLKIKFCLGLFSG
jgi:Ca2+-binding EF-hand superfamily protein